MSPSTRKSPEQNRLSNEPVPSQHRGQHPCCRCQCRAASGWFCEPTVSRGRENTLNNRFLHLYSKTPQATGRENIGLKRTLPTLPAPGPVNSRPRITLEDNGKFQPQPDREIPLTRVCGGEIGIRTLGRLAPSTVFETAAFDHSATSPHEIASLSGGAIPSGAVWVAQEGKCGLCGAGCWR